MHKPYPTSNTRIVLGSLNLRDMFLHQKEQVEVTLLLLHCMLLVVGEVEVDQARKNRKPILLTAGAPTKTIKGKLILRNFDPKSILIVTSWCIFLLVR